jgi:hypothetical protein
MALVGVATAALVSIVCGGNDTREHESGTTLASAKEQHGDEHPPV